VPVHPVHPDPEELAAWQAGELSGAGGARIEAHVAGCADCAGMLAAVERGRAALAGLAEAEPPAGLHERLATAIEREVAEPIRLDRRRHATPPRPRGRRSPAGRRRIAALSAAAAVILLVAGLVPLLRHGGGQTVATQSAGGRPAAAPSFAGGGEGSLPVFSAPDGYSGSALQSALRSDPAARAAYQRAAGGSQASGLGESAPQTPQPGSGGGSGAATESGDAARGFSGTAKSTTGAQAPAGLQQLTCLASARNQAGDQGLRPAFFVNTVYRGRPATVLVTVRPGAPDQADLWAFPRDDCSAAPFAHDRATVIPP
jgi:hypothetical protein